MPLPSPESLKGLGRLLGIDVEQTFKDIQEAIKPVWLYTIRKDGKTVEVPVGIGLQMCGEEDKETGEWTGGMGWRPIRNQHNESQKRQVVQISWQAETYYVPLLSVPKSITEAIERAAPETSL